MKTHYDLLGVPPDAPAEQIKQAFRHAIARYHPDKVQHLGDEFQQLAQARAADLTTAYKTLTDPERRAEYDRELAEQPTAPPPPAPDAAACEPEPQAPRASDGAPCRDTRFESMRSDRDLLLRRAALARLDHLFSQAFSVSERPDVPGFDLSCLSKGSLFERARRRPWLLAKFVDRLDERAVHEVWARAVRANAMQKAEVSVFVLTSELASQRELAAAMAVNRDLADPGRRITIIPVDVRDWRALIPTDAHPAARALAARLGTT